MRTQLEQENFLVLDSVAAAERAGRTRFPGGGWKLYGFYSAVESPKVKPPATEAEWADTLDRLKRWAAQRPESVTAHVALGYAYLNYAWQARGQGDAASVTVEGGRLMQERLKLAETELQRAEGKCPEWYYVMLQVGRLKGWEAEDLTDFLQRAITFEPEFYYSYQEVARGLMPKWRGKEGDVEKFAEDVGQQGRRQSRRYSLLADYAIDYWRSRSGKYCAASLMVAGHGGTSGACGPVWVNFRRAEPTGADGRAVWRLHGDGRNHDANWRSLGPRNMGNKRIF